MNRYESIFILKPDLVEEEEQKAVEKYRGLIESQKGGVIQVDQWGKRRLAYPVKKQGKGIYILVDFYAPGTVVQELERNYKIDEAVLKYLTVKVKEDFDPESLKEEAKKTEAQTVITEEEMKEAVEPGPEAEEGEPS
jgi:small subunit ribosomal protein S6